MDKKQIKYVIFDTFGTVADWHSSVIEEGKKLGSKYGFEINWHEFANRWRDEGYLHAIFEIAAGRRPWEAVDQIHMKKLLSLAEEYNWPKIEEEDLNEFNLIWHRLKPWEDAVDGLTKLKQQYRIGPFSNGDFGLILDMAKHALLPWDFITTADIFKKFKPDPEIYKEEIQLLGVQPEEVLMVAAHRFDLDGAKSAGCWTAFVPRPLEYGPESDHTEPEGKMPVDLEFPDFRALAEYMTQKEEKRC